MNEDIPYAAGRVPTRIEIVPTVRAYGSCVRTCSMWLHELARELRIVVSDIGEQ